MSLPNCKMHPIRKNAFLCISKGCEKFMKIQCLLCLENTICANHDWQTLQNFVDQTLICYEKEKKYFDLSLDFYKNKKLELQNNIDNIKDTFKFLEERISKVIKEKADIIRNELEPDIIKTMKLSPQLKKLKESETSTINNEISGIYINEILKKVLHYVDNQKGTINLKRQNIKMFDTASRLEKINQKTEQFNKQMTDINNILFKYISSSFEKISLDFSKEIKKPHKKKFSFQIKKFLD